jgi:hypothetical protein
LEIKIDSLEAGQHHYYPQAMRKKKVAAFRSSESLLQVAGQSVWLWFSLLSQCFALLAGKKSLRRDRKSIGIARSHLIQSSSHQIAFDKVQFEEEIRLEICKMFLAKPRYQCEINFLAGDEKLDASVVKKDCARCTSAPSRINSRKTFNFPAQQEDKWIKSLSMREWTESRALCRANIFSPSEMKSLRALSKLSTNRKSNWLRQTEATALVGALEWNYSQLKSEKSGKRRLSDRRKAS